MTNARGKIERCLRIHLNFGHFAIPPPLGFPQRTLEVVSRCTKLDKRIKERGHVTHRTICKTTAMSAGSVA